MSRVVPSSKKRVSETTPDQAIEVSSNNCSNDPMLPQPRQVEQPKRSTSPVTPQNSPTMVRRFLFDLPSKLIPHKGNRRSFWAQRTAEKERRQLQAREVDRVNAENAELAAACDEAAGIDAVIDPMELDFILSDDELDDAQPGAPGVPGPSGLQNPRCLFYVPPRRIPDIDDDSDDEDEVPVLTRFY